MKLIHCADLHLDSKMETNLAPEKAKERKREILHTFERMVEYGAAHQVQAIIIAGDMFDTARITNSTKTRVLNTIKQFAQIDFLYLSGNHDESNFINLLTEVPANLKIFGPTWTQFAYPELKVTGAVLTADNHRALCETLQLAPQDVNIVVLHGQVGQTAGKSCDESINLAQLKNRNIDYLALGHIHSYTLGVLDQRGKYCYSGCLEGRGFDECGAKGFVLLDVNHGSVQTEFVPFARRQLVERTFDLTGCTDWFVLEKQICDAVKDLSSDHLLRIVLTGKYKIDLEKHLAMLEQKLERFYLVQVEDDSVLDVSSQDVAHDVSLRGEFIRQVLASKLSAAEKERTILVGLKALSGEDL